ncbi:NAD-dependent epimerase/dehydratase family protein [Curtobacterium sp. APC 4022]|uniref:polysaccharide biosynthesis C-terminal domain-containing protein n=1 Tax=Curtobacterium sp. APC 4022 TaxID=3035201 RepID=UPI0025B53FA6|nr:NAD-dependent epimerase/dehydratase family protein [Curtobacterium sp. APC 4022]MDN3477805.1 NAD-dependent epimerase/dehydratase family protein [Curtobacterium sp. APC 4022]
MIAISGRGGLVGWHLRTVLHAHGRSWRDVDLRATVPVVEGAGADGSSIETAIHVAGISRGPEQDVRDGNTELARRFVAALERAVARPRRVVYANTGMSGTTPYTEGKARAGEVLAAAAARWGAEYVDVVIDNVFGEHGTPYHNGVALTFCHRIARGEQPQVDSTDIRTFVHAQDVGEALAGMIDQAELRRRGTTLAIPELADRIGALATPYRRGEFPVLRNAFDRDLFNTYRSYAFALDPVHRLGPAVDGRGSFTELVRAHGSAGQTSMSTTLPGVTRGDHFHRRKVERFVVVQGEAQIVLRRVLTDERQVIRVTGDEPVAVDMPTLWAHSVTNTGDVPLVTVFWADELFDPARPDTHQEPA